MVILLPLVGLSWRLQLDKDGFTRRMFFLHDRWTWEDLSSGRIRKAHPFTLVDPQKPWWLRRLRLEYLSNSDREELLHRINACYVFPPPPEVGDSLTIRYGFRRRATLGRDGLHLQVKGHLHVYRWEEVVQVLITRTDPKSLHFSRLEIVLPDQVIDLGMYQSTPRWEGASAEDVNAFLFQLLPMERFDIVARGVKPHSRSRIERELTAARKMLREAHVIFGIALFLLPPLWIGMAMDNGPLRTCGVMLLPCMAIFLFCWYHRRDATRRIEKWSALLEEAERRAAGSQMQFSAVGSQLDSHFNRRERRDRRGKRGLV
jgi:hypothetical protein